MRTSHAVLAAALALAVVGCSDVVKQQRDIGQTDTSEAVDAGPEDVADPADDTSEADSSGADSKSADSGSPDASGPCRTDTDDDGLSDCEEQNLCTDPDADDSDGDGLTDFEELQLQTDPCAADSDGDGLDDGNERDLGFDPDDDDTDDDGTKDGEEWIVDACETTEPAPIELYTSNRADWTVALAPGFRNYTELNLTGVGADTSAAFYDHAATGVSGLLSGHAASMDETSPAIPLDSRVVLALRSQGTVERQTTGGRFDTHDRHAAATGRYELQTDTSMTPKALREALLFELEPYSRSQARVLPATNGTKHTDYRVFVTLLLRRGSDNAPDQMLTALALAPEAAYDTNEQIRFQIDDLTNTTNIAEAGAAPTSRCQTFQAIDTRPDLEVYFVVDADLGSLASKVRTFAGQFADELANTRIDYRFGVTNMHPANQGRLHSSANWTEDKSTLLAALDDAALDCKSTGAWQCSGRDPHGLQVARTGIEFMSGNAASTPPDDQKVRPNAQILTFFFTDDPAASIETGTSVGSYKSYFQKSSVVAAITPGDDCDAPAAGQAYRDVAAASGGKSGSLCANNLSQITRDFIFTTAGIPSSQPVLSTLPISSSVAVWFEDAQRVPRSRKDGFDYFASRNGLSFFGMFHKENYAPLPYFQVVHYETFAGR